MFDADPLTTFDDHLRWFSSGSSATILVKDVYSDLIHSMAPASAPLFPTSLWKTGCPPRMIYFAWLLFNNKNLTWDNLQKRSWQGPSICFSCESDVETNLHIFFSCRLSLELWSDLARLYSFPMFYLILFKMHSNGGLPSLPSSALSSSSPSGSFGGGGTIGFFTLLNLLSTLLCHASAPFSIPLQWFNMNTTFCGLLRSMNPGFALCFFYICTPITLLCSFQNDADSMLAPHAAMTVFCNGA